MHRHARFPATSRRRRAPNGRSPAARPTRSRAAAYCAADHETQGRLARPPHRLRLSREGSVSRSRPLERAAQDAEKRRAATGFERSVVFPARGMTGGGARRFLQKPKAVCSAKVLASNSRSIGARAGKTSPDKKSVV